MDQILITYYANNARKLHNMVNQILLKFGGLSDRDLDDFYSLANEVFVNVMRRYDNSQSFDAFLYSCLLNKIKTEITKRNRIKRRSDRMAISIDTPIGDDENSTIGDMIADVFSVENEIFGEKKKEKWRKEVIEYLNNLSPLQKKIVLLLSNDNTPDDICEELHITMKHFDNSMKRILSDERIKPLRPLVERM